MRFLILLFFTMPAFAEVPAAVSVEVSSYVQVVGDIAIVVLQCFIGWWALKKILVVSITGGARRGSIR